MRCTLTEDDFKEFQKVCSEVIIPKDEQQFLWVHGNGSGNYPDQITREDLEKRERSKDLFRAILCNNAAGAKTVLNAAMREIDDAKFIKNLKRVSDGNYYATRLATKPSRRMSNAL